MLRQITAGLALALSALAAAAQSEPLKVEDLFRPAAFSSPVLSSNGRYFAVRVPVHDRLQLTVVDLDKRVALRVTDMKDFDVLDMTWVGNDHIVVDLGQARSPTGPRPVEGGGLFMVSRDGNTSKHLWETTRDFRGQFEELKVVQTIPGNDSEVIAAGNLREGDSIDLYQLNILTGERKLLTKDRPKYAMGWLLDHNRVPRIVTTWVEDTLSFIVHYRKDEGSPWTELIRYDQTTGPTFIPLAFEDDNKTLQVAFNGGRETMAIYRYDPDAKALGELIAQHPRYDLGADAAGGLTGGILTDRFTRKIVGYRVDADRPQMVWTDEDYAKIQRTIDQVLPDAVNLFSRSEDGKRYLVTSISDRRASNWYLYDQDKNRFEELFNGAPWLKPELLVEQRPFILKTRDGLEIPGYYFLPKDRKPGEKLPTVVHIHGGPNVRADGWGSGLGWFEGQLLASRGYAVIVPNFRITPGFGSKIYYGGFGTFGRAMLEDHEDAAKWAIAEGIADPDRICASGASYGGYASLMVLARFPSVFKCAVAGLIVSDVELQLISKSTDFSSSPAAIEHWKKMIGVKSTRDISPDISPVTFADRIKQPVLIYAGEDDQRTPIEQTRRMVRALERAGNPPKATIIKRGEGHGYHKTENLVDLYTQVLKFLDQNLGKRTAP